MLKDVGLSYLVSVPREVGDPGGGGGGSCETCFGLADSGLKIGWALASALAFTAVKTLQPEAQLGACHSQILQI